MFIIIFGIRGLRKAMGPVRLRCGNCEMSPLSLFRVSRWFSLFFIPLIPVGVTHYTVCPNCKELVQLDDADLEEALDQAESAWSASSPAVTSGPTCNMNGCRAPASKYLMIGEQDGLRTNYYVCRTHRPDVRIGSSIRILGDNTIAAAGAEEQLMGSSTVFGIASIDDMNTPSKDSTLS